MQGLSQGGPARHWGSALSHLFPVTGGWVKLSCRYGRGWGRHRKGGKFGRREGKADI